MDFIVSLSSRMSRVSIISSSRLLTLESRVRSSSVKRTLLLGTGSPDLYVVANYFNILILSVEASAVSSFSPVHSSSLYMFFVMLFLTISADEEAEVDG